MTVRTFGRDQVGDKYHVEYPTMKHVENSPHGVRWAAHHGFETIDLDMLPDEDLVEMVTRAFRGAYTLTIDDVLAHLWNEHWPQPIRRDGFHDPKHRLGRTDNMNEMRAFEVERLVARHFVHGRFRTFRIPRIADQIALCHTEHIKALIEPKQSKVFLHPEVWAALAHIADVHQTKTAVYSQHHEYLPLARAAGFKAWGI